MEKKKISEVVFQGGWHNRGDGIRVGSIPKVHLNPDNNIGFELGGMDEYGYNDEARIIIIKDRIETDEEFELREKSQEELKKSREKFLYKRYLELKDKFES